MYEIIVSDVFKHKMIAINFSQHTFRRRNRKQRAIEGQLTTENQRVFSQQYLLPVLSIRSGYGAFIRCAKRLFRRKPWLLCENGTLYYVLYLRIRGLSSGLWPFDDDARSSPLFQRRFCPSRHFPSRQIYQAKTAGILCTSSYVRELLKSRASPLEVDDRC